MLELRGVSKRFGSTQALDSVDLRLHAGEIVGLLGHNGSGKSTLVGVLAGAHVPEPGARAWLRGRLTQFPLQRQDTHLGVVAQDLALVEKLTVLENLTIGQRIAPRSRDRLRISWRGERRLAAQLLASYGLDLPLSRPVSRPVSELTLLERAMLAIVRCAKDLGGPGSDGSGPGRLMVLDEPTVFLPAKEKEFLFRLVRQHAAEGTGVIIISHDLGVIRELAERAIVLRSGRITAEVDVREVTERDLVDLIIGQTPTFGELTVGRHPAHRPAGEPESEAPAREADK